ncbi:MAG: hypothetical protein JRI68_16575 [Deltaproteobacteria bacterium]|nr:hypothetical protein [Deltaproteobacteria bacterium]
MKLRRLILLLLVLVGLPGGLVVLTGAKALAQPRDAATEAAMKAARPHAEKGFALFEQERYAACIAEFERAEARYHAIPHLLYIARAMARLGRLIEARNGLRAVVEETLDDRSPRAFHLAQVEAKADLGELEGRIPTVQVAITGLGADGATLIVDGQEIGAPPETLELDPGHHTLEARGDGAWAPPQSVTLEPGDRTQITLEMQAAEDDGSLMVPALVCFGVGGLGLVIGTITGIVSLNQTADIDEQCEGEHCPASLEGDADAAKATGNASTAFFVIGGLAAAAGATLLLLDSPGESDSAASLQLRVGPGAVQLQGTF